MLVKVAEEFGEGLFGAIVFDDSPKFVAPAVITNLGVDLDEEVEVVRIGDLDFLAERDRSVHDPSGFETLSLFDFSRFGFLGLAKEFESPAGRTRID